MKQHFKGTSFENKKVPLNLHCWEYTTFELVVCCVLFRVPSINEGSSVFRSALPWVLQGAAGNFEGVLLSCSKDLEMHGL